MGIEKIKSIAPIRIEPNSSSMKIAGIGENYLFTGPMNPSSQWQKITPHLGNIAGQASRETYGLSFDMVDNRGIHYFCGVKVSDQANESDLPDGFEIRTLPSSDYAVFEHDGDVSDIRSTCEAIWHQWIPQSGYRKPQNANYFFERYGEKFNPRTGSGDIEIWIPVTR